MRYPQARFAVPLLKQLARGDPPGGAALRQISAQSGERRGLIELG